jgi:serine/threonine protein kinase
MVAIQSEYVVKLETYFENSVAWFLVIELCDGSLVKYMDTLNRSDKFLTEAETIDFLAQILAGFKAIHE